MSDPPLKEKWRDLGLGIWDDFVQGQSERSKGSLPSRSLRRRLVPPLKNKPRTLGSCDPASLSFLLSSLSEKHPGRLWILSPFARQRELLSDELSFWKTPTLHLSDPTIVVDGELTDPDREAERLATLQNIDDRPDTPVILSRLSLNSKVPTYEELTTSEISLALDDDFPPEKLTTWLEENDYEEHPQIYQRQQFARRGGIIDFYPPRATAPLRIEFFGDTIDSIREFNLDTQSTTKRLKKCAVRSQELKSSIPLRDRVQKNDLIVALCEDDLDEAHLFLTDDPNHDWLANCYPSPAAGFQAGDFVVADHSRQLFLDQLADWKSEGWEIALVTPTEAEKERFYEILGSDFDSDAHFSPIIGRLSRGFLFPEKKLAVLSTLEIFGRHHLPQARRKGTLDHQRSAAAHAAVHELNEGDLVVHADYGVGEFLGLVDGDDGSEELGIEYDNGATLHVPIDQSHLVARYVGLGGKKPKLSKLGDQKWSRLRQKAESAVLDYAAQLLRLQAERETLEAEPHPPDNQWMWEFEHAFPYTETPDQKNAIEETKQDMESPRPMDRLICGDVGFGKTEIAIRAAFKAATGGKQVAILAPTTVLAEQHWRNFRERMSDYPLRIDLLSRLRTPAESRATIEGLLNGSVDIVIGTHRLLSKEIAFKNIGLLVVDEEQRFGVRHKEQLKERFSHIDVLTLSATPIPRTLYLSLMGARDMSTIDTPPPNRLPVTTSVCAYDERLIRNAIRRELSRGGQVFFLHNRVQTIESVKKRINELVPEAKVIIGHGQMDKNDLEVVMKTFVASEADILLATTIIESGIDIPNANTILIDRADRFGLADLYQLRGRVGRAGRRAYAILLLPPDQISSGDSRKRLNAIKQYTELGSGFKIAMRDLEIRGAGSLLGTKQSGHIVAVGFDLYCQLLRQSIDQLKGKTSDKRADCVIKTDFLTFSETTYEPDSEKLPAFFPRDYAPHGDLRVTAYRQLAALKNERELDALIVDWRDRFGKPPHPVEILLQTARLRVVASARNVQSVEIKNQRLMIQRNGSYLLPADGKFPRLQNTQPEKMLDEAIAMIRSL